ncbi:MULTISPECIES: N-6 DNA methylase [Rhodococcus]|uniref:Eco57I restriction-modification methylase domain-containing protein n=1 Tax=Rhodococcus TaxID=1827 RepID=UPI00193B4982|nr:MULTISPECIES: N-6 DNA methylase [Rhodococcus]QRI75054.1 N-6 DNA methylase [Rhodococcus aetherivorans]QSE58463.1 N-6 DNA methylase [Rhodococcus sp. PSBB066]QSE70214.1 N-6 DNA methylase [Rhodococcus sp. PSBB049]
MGEVLNSGQRNHLDRAVQRARIAAEQAAADALRALAVAEPSRPAYLSDDHNTLRLALRDKARQLGDDTARIGADLTNLVREVAYEQWHRLLFARFLEVNGLLRHPEFRDTSLTLEDCTDLADDLGEPDSWSVAARFASEILPGVFRLDDPAVQVRFATEHRLELEKILLGIPAEVFLTEDALGWVYQFWQTAEKKRVNESGLKIGGADLSPVTQLFTENYMVRFLLENSLGAWWAARHPESPLVNTWEYLRRLDDGTPAAGTFDEWPATAADVTVMDPCCGSGHFLVAMFGMLWRMRAEEEGLSAADAQDAVLRDNLHGLELDPRCTQIATFDIALEAWKQGGFRELPAPQIACSGVPVRGTRTDWEALAGGDDELRKVLVRLHGLFRNADTLGSLVSPRPNDVGDALFGRDLSVGASWELVRRALRDAFRAEAHDTSVLGHAADDVVQAAALLSRMYTLVATNPPYLQRRSMAETLQDYIDSAYPLARADIATAFIERCLEFAGSNGTVAVVSPQNWLLLGSYAKFRDQLLNDRRFDAVARLGAGAFRQISGEIVKVSLSVISAVRPQKGHRILGLLVHRVDGADQKAIALRRHNPLTPEQADQGSNPDQRITLTRIAPGSLLAELADGMAGIQTGDYPRFGRVFWERPLPHPDWEFQQSTVRSTQPYGGREHIIWWEGGNGRFHRFVAERLGEWGVGAWIRGDGLKGRRGVAVSQMGDLPVTIYTGELFDNNTATIIPMSESDLPAIWAYCSSSEFADDVRDLDDALKVTNATLVKVAFDRERWKKVADDMGPMPVPHSDDPTQWLFAGSVASSDHPLQVAVARLLGYRWPDQKPDALDQFADKDGISALQSLPGEPDLATRLRELLAAVYGDKWSSALERRLVDEAGGKNGRLEDWLRDTFFAQHVKVFDNRPYLWHIWDGRKDGFSVIVNYHRLDHRTLEKLTFTSLGSWIERQRHEAAAGRSGADARLAAAEGLQAKLKLILDGAPPYDVYVRWKELHEQPIGWNPDLDDGVRLNIRPFVTADVLRIKLSSKIKWAKDRGTNPDGSERINDLHPTLEERRAARRHAEVKL